MDEDEAMFKAMRETAKRIRRSGDEVHPIMVIDCKDGKAVWADLQPWWGEQNVRQTLMYQLGSTLGFGLEAVSFYIVTDVWIGTNVDLQPSKDPQRTEAIVVSRFPREGEHTMEVTRYAPAGKRLKFEEPKRLDAAVDYTFHLFWKGYEESEKRIGAFGKLFGLETLETEMDTGFTGREHAKAAALKVAMATFKFELLKPGELEKRAHDQWRAVRN